MKAVTIAADAGRPFAYGAKGLACDDVALERLARRFATPLYCYSWRSVAARFRALDSALGAALPASRTLCYAVKANSNQTLLRRLAGLGAGFDIVSGGELERVRRAAPEALGRVVFSGVGKTREEIDEALRAKILLFNVESEPELQLLAARAKALKMRARFALRVNPDVFAETHPYISTGLRDHKFGVPIAAARRIYRVASKMPSLQAAGISVHIGSQIRQAEPFGSAIVRVAALVKALRSDGIALQYLDAGGGLGVDYDPARSFDAEPVATRYAKAIAEGIAKLDGVARMHLLFEPGRFLVAHAGCLLTRVLFVKKSGSRTFVVVDAGMNDLLRPALYGAKHAIVAVRPRSGRVRTVDVVGPVCETADSFASDVSLGPVQAGDLLAILDAGAYGMTLSSNYNARPRAAEVLVDGTRAQLVRRRESLDDLLAGEEF